jgi:hypothetical protein
MAGLDFTATPTAEVALSAGATRTVVQVVAPANQRVKIKGYGISFDGTSVTAEPVLVQLVRQSTAGTMTALTLIKDDPGRDETIQATAQHSATVEPATGDILDQIHVHPQGGYVWMFPLGGEKWINGGGRAGIRVITPAGVNPNCVAKMFCEE